MKVEFVGTYDGHKVDREGESTIKLKAATSEIAPVSSLVSFIGGVVKVTIEEVK